MAECSSPLPSSSSAEEEWLSCSECDSYADVAKDEGVKEMNDRDNLLAEVKMLREKIGILEEKLEDKTKEHYLMKKEYQKLKEKVEMLLTEGHRDGLLPCISHFTSLVSEERDDLLCLEVKPVMEYSVQEVASGATDYDEDKIMRKLEERLLKGTKKEEENGENLDVLGAVSQQFESQLARLGTHTEDLPVESDNASISSKDSPTSAPCYGTLTSSSQLVHLPLTSTECQLHQ